MRDRYRFCKGILSESDMPIKYHQTVWCTNQTVDFIHEHHEKNWLLSLNMFDPHPPFDAPDEYRNRYSMEKVHKPLFRESDMYQQAKLKPAYHQTRKPKAPGPHELEDVVSYYGMIELIDDQLGRILDALEASGQKENTLVIFMSDHGEMLWDHGISHKGSRFYEGAVRVPLIMSWPGVINEGVVSQELVELTDLAPTLAELINTPLERTHGLSLWPILKGNSEGIHRDYVRCEYYDTITEKLDTGELPQPNGPTFASMYYDGRYKLIVYHHTGVGELYDHQLDPDEYDDVWNKDSYVEVKHQLLLKSYNRHVLSMDMGPPKIHPF